MTTKDEALRMARESAALVLAYLDAGTIGDHAVESLRSSLAAIDAALAEPQGVMPQLPPAEYNVGWNIGGWSVDQMRTYGRACADAARKADEALMRQALEALSAIYTEVVDMDDAFSARQIVRNYGKGTIAALRDRLGESHE